MGERRGLLTRLGLRGASAGAQERPQPLPAIPPADAAAAAELAREAATPFGYRRPARELLAAFGGSGEEERRRATAALARIGIAAEPSLSTAAPDQFVQLRRAAAAPSAAAASAPPVGRSVADGATPEPRAAAAAPRGGARVPAAQRVAARFAPTAPVTSDRRIAAGALGLGALLVVLVLAVALRGLAGDGDSAATALPPDDPAPAAAATATAPAAAAPERSERGAAEAAPPTATAPAAAAERSERGAAEATPPAAAHAGARRPAPRAVRLTVVPAEPSYLCVADGAGRTLWEGMRTGPYVVRGPKLIVRVGVASARIAADGRPVRVTTAPGAFELTPRAIRPLPGDAHVCGSAAAAPPPAATG